MKCSRLAACSESPEPSSVRLLQGSNRRHLALAWTWLSLVVLIGCLMPAPASGQTPWQVRFVTNNDFLTDNEVNDDFYTFGARIEVSRGAWTVRWDENAFTDRVDDFRFDETYLTVGGLLPADWFGGLCVWVEGGVAHVGEGLLGEEAQNELHDLIGDDPVILDYLPGVDDYHLHLNTEIGQQWKLTDSWTLGPQAGAAATFDFRSNAFVGLRSIWKPSERFGLDVTVGNRWTDTDLDVLGAHLKDSDLAAQVEIKLPWHFVIEWSRNRYGTGRDHFSIGCSFGAGESPRRHGAWIEAGATP